MSAPQSWVGLRLHKKHFTTNWKAIIYQLMKHKQECTFENSKENVHKNLKQRMATA